MVDKVEWFVKKSPFADRKDPDYIGSTFADFGGDWNGYIIVPKSNPVFGEHYDNLEFNVHGGFTFGSSAEDIEWPEIPEHCRNDNYWIYGWDTQHLHDTKTKWPKERVEKECARISLEIQILGIFKEREINMSKRK